METSIAAAHAHYEKALASVKKDSSELPVLDHILNESGNKSPREIPLGIQNILLEQIVGTRSEGRKNCFSRDFMPMMPVNSEFAGKWISLCASHLDEGIHTPILAYEYMNRYYVAEGNKRVSVSKYFDTYTIAADVIRLMPLPDDSPEYRSYCEYTAFYSLSGINYLQFSRPGCYEKLQELVGKAPDESWTSDEQTDFGSVFIRFRENYLKLMGSQPLVNVCDAFLSFITVFDYRTFLEADTADLKEKIAKYEKEFRRLLTPEPPTLKTDPFEKKPNIIQALVPKLPSLQKFAFIYPKNPHISGWTRIHDKGRRHLEETFPEKLTTEVYKDTDPSNIQETLAKAIADGCRVIFTTTPVFLKETLRFAVEHPEIKFLNCNPQMSYKNVRTYYARLYEVKFILGAIAGAMTETNRIGYIAEYPILSAVSDINAFALGARMVNPRVQIILRWSKQQYDDQGNEMSPDDIYQDFAAEGIRIICDRDIPIPGDSSGRTGLYLVNENGIEPMAAPVWNWNVFYEKTAANILNGNWKAEAQTDKGKGLRYWWGLSSGLVDISLSPRLPLPTQRLAWLLRRSFIDNGFNPFSGRLFSQEKEIQSDPEDSLSPDQILNMDWLTEGVVGSIPPRSSFNDQAKEVAAFAGVDTPPYVL